MQDQSPAPAAPPGLQIERATAGGELVGYRLRCGNNTLLAFEDQGAMPGFRLGDNFVGAFTGPKIEYAPVGLATPPAVMPAAPSDAVLEAIKRFGDACYTKAVHEAGDWMQNKDEPRVTAADVRAAEATLLAALSQTMQPQAEPENGYCVGCGGSGEQTFLSGGGPDAYDEIGNCQRCEGTGAEPAAGEQAGAVAPKERCPNCDDTGDVNSITGEWRGVCHCPAGQAINNLALAAPGAAISAREQDGDWRIDRSAGRPILVYKNCSVIEAEDAEYVLRLIAADRASREGAPDPLLIDSMCMRWRHDFGLQRSIDDPLSGFTDAERDSLRRSMRQLWEEVVGLGFYRPAQAAAAPRPLAFSDAGLSRLAAAVKGGVACAG